MRITLAKFLLPSLAAFLCAGCLSSAPQAPTCWTVEWRPEATDRGTDPKPLPLTLRVSDILVRAPYAGMKLAVLRADGSLAFDPYNVFAAAPAQLLRGAAFDALDRSGRFAHVIDHSSQARADMDVEITVTRFALDCRTEGRHDARVELSVSFIAKGDVIAVGAGQGVVRVGDGNYSDGFSRAFSGALIEAAQALKSGAVK